MLVEANIVVSPTAEPKQNGVEGPTGSLPSFAEGIGAGEGVPNLQGRTGHKHNGECMRASQGMRAGTIQEFINQTSSRLRISRQRNRNDSVVPRRSDRLLAAKTNMRVNKPEKQVTKRC